MFEISREGMVVLGNFSALTVGSLLLVHIFMNYNIFCWNCEG